MNDIALFADVQNIYYTTRERYGRQFNYTAWWRAMASRGRIVLASAYAIDRGDPGQLKFQQALRHIGFDVKLKPFIQRSDGSAKGDWDVGITIDVLKAASKVDIIALLSGDGDFDRLMSEVESLGKKTIVYGVPGLTARSLIDAATEFYDIDEPLLL